MARYARLVVPPHTRLWRVHDRNEPADRLRGNVFVSESSTTALAEWVLPNATRGASDRPLQWDGDLRLVNRCVSAVRATTELVLLRLLDQQDLAAAGVGREPSPWRPEAWANHVRDEMPDVAGMAWESRFDLHRPTMLLFGDRCPAGTLQPEPDSALRLDSGAGARYLNRQLAAFGARIPVPAATGPLVFVNYRSSDDKLVVDLLDKLLCERFGDSAVFRDDRSLGIGVPFEAELLSKVRACKVLITVIGERWEKTYDSAGQRLLDRPSDWVRREIAEALAHGVYIAPVLVGARGWPAEAVLPDDIKRLAGHQFGHLPHRYTGDHVRELVDRLVREVPALGNPE